MMSTTVAILTEAELRIYASVNLPSLVQIITCPSSAPSHYLKQCWNIVNPKLRNKLRWNLNRNLYIFTKKCIWKCRQEMSAFCLGLRQCVTGGGIKLPPPLNVTTNKVNNMTIFGFHWEHYSDVIISAMASQINSLTIVYSTGSGADQRKHQISASLASVRGIHRWPVNSPHKGPVTRNMFPFDDIIMQALATPPMFILPGWLPMFRSQSLFEKTCHFGALLLPPGVCGSAISISKL